MRRIATSLLLATLLVGCTSEAPSSSDDDDGFITETTTSAGSGGAGSTTSTSAATSGSGGASTSTSSGSGGAGSGGSGSGGSVTLGPGDLVITEIMNNPAAVTDAEGEWFEVHNPTSQPIDMTGLTIQHGIDSSAVHVINAPLVVPPQGYAVLGRNSDPTTNGGAPVDYVYPSSVSLNNTNDYLAILASGTLIDETSWDELSGLDPDGASRSLDRQSISASLNDNDTNFCEATSLMPYGDRGTPGTVNDDCF